MSDIMKTSDGTPIAEDLVGDYQNAMMRSEQDIIQARPRVFIEYIERISRAEAERDALKADYQKLDDEQGAYIETLKDAVGDELLLGEVDPEIGFVPEDIVRIITALKAKVARLSAPVSDEERKAWNIYGVMAVDEFNAIIAARAKEQP